jgi:hypothetical protein
LAVRNAALVYSIYVSRVGKTKLQSEGVLYIGITEIYNDVLQGDKGFIKRLNFIGRPSLSELDMKDLLLAQSGS